MFHDMLFTFDSEKKVPEINGIPTFSASVAKRKGTVPFGLFFKSGTNLFKNTFVCFFIIKVALPNVAFRSKANTCLRFDTKL